MTVKSVNKLSLPRLILACAIPLGVGAAGAALAGNNFDIYASLTRPPLAPPAFIFPIVWTALYILMGIASYFIFEKRTEESRKALTVYAFYLVLNLLWPTAFFKKGAFLAALFLLAAQIILLFGILSSYSKIDKRSAYLMLPTLVWSIFALYLNGGYLYLNP